MADCYSFTKRFTNEEIIALNKLHTKQLLNKRNCFYGSCGADYYISSSAECNICMRNQEYNLAQIKKILATRERVLNKQEAKALRKQRIKEGR